jgi:hypothetical protein
MLQNENRLVLLKEVSAPSLYDVVAF